uniref:Uncharacterized protein n=1 Tax=Percolomonas cosmopolitus TaxID=63605 RepID=A0A7S1KM12_9EUKA|mmetsp:Transcript_11181/g.41837  ORF Transcript_11181/g.41837 Transcript_11181/m.41837 type:complete len:468 (+) Transcript_11181:1013-2416(+)
MSKRANKNSPPEPTENSVPALTRQQLFLPAPSSFASQLLTPQLLINSYFSHRKKIQNLNPQLQKSATRIQRTWRKHKLSGDFRRKRDGCMLIQKTFRAYLYGRKRLSAQRLKHEQQMHQNYFHYCASQIQRVWRGYKVRRHDELNFYTRKHELQLIQQNQRSLQQYIKKTLKAKEDEQHQLDSQDKLNKFHTMASELHHLVSTKSISGVYNPPHLPLTSSTLQKTTSLKGTSAHNVPLESTLRSLARKNARLSLRKARGARGSSSLLAPQKLNATHKELFNQMGVLSGGATMTGMGAATSSSTGQAQFRTNHTDGSAKLHKDDLARLANATIAVDPRDASRSNPHQRIGPFLPQHKLIKRKYTTYESSVLRSSSYEHQMEEEREQNRLNHLTQISAQPFVSCKKPDEGIILRKGASMRSTQREPSSSRRRRNDKLVAFKPKVRTSAPFDRSTMPDIGPQSAPRVSQR